MPDFDWPSSLAIGLPSVSVASPLRAPLQHRRRPMALDNSLLKAMTAQVEAIVTGSSNTPAALRAAAAAATNVAAMLQLYASALDTDLDSLGSAGPDADREGGAAMARVEGEVVRCSQPSSVRTQAPRSPPSQPPPINNPNPTPTQFVPEPHPAAPSLPSKIGLSSAALRQVLLYSSTITIANATLVSKEMRDAFFMCKDEVVTKLLHQRSPRMAQVMKLVAKKGTSTCGCAGEITALYRRTVEVEMQIRGTTTQHAPPPAIDFSEVIVSFELSAQGGKVGSWTAALGPMFKDGEFRMSVPPEVLQTLDLPTVGCHHNLQVTSRYEVMQGMGVKIFVSAVNDNQLRTNIVYNGGPQHDDFDTLNGRGIQYTYYDYFQFEGCTCSRGSPVRGEVIRGNSRTLDIPMNQFTDVTVTCDRSIDDAEGEIRYAVTCYFREVPYHGGTSESVSQSNAAAWIRHLVAR